MSHNRPHVWFESRISQEYIRGYGLGMQWMEVETDLMVDRVQGTRYKPIAGEIVSTMTRYIYRDDYVLDSAVACKAEPFYVPAYLERVNPDDLRRFWRYANPGAEPGTPVGSKKGGRTQPAREGRRRYGGSWDAWARRWASRLQRCVTRP